MATEKSFAFTSYGNDSIALIRHLYETKRGAEVYTVYSNTGWAAPEWAARVSQAETIVRSYGFIPVQIESEGFVPLAIRKKGFPRNGMQFCTEQLKILPAQRWLNSVDPEREGVCAVGVRREESRARSTWPEWTEESEKHGGRPLWAPLVRVTTEQRDALIRRAGLEPLLHRSRECYPCINSNRADLRALSSERVEYLAELEASMGLTSEGKPRTLFRPGSHQGAVGIREIVRWAHSERGKYEAPSAGCDSGFCGE